jgi:hypothetical protein
VRAISLWQPWATAMAIGLKRIETRHWTCSYRGPIVIHAAKRWRREEREWAKELASLHDAPALADPPLGAIVAVARLVDIRRTEFLLEGISETEEMFGNYGDGRFGWLFEDIQALPSPVPFKGAQGFFDVPNDLLTPGWSEPQAAQAGLLL